MQQLNLLEYLLNGVADIFWPPQCHICGEKPGPTTQWFCDHCLMTLPRAVYRGWDLNPMAQKLAGKVPFEQCSAFLEYSAQGVLAPVFHDFKYRGFSNLARFMGRMAASDYEMSAFFNHIDYLLPVPMYRFKQWRRGYNQAVEIARGISDVSDIPLGKGLTAVRSHRSQTGLNAEKRRENTKGLFRYRPAAEQIGTRVCLIDDICTTGSTLVAAAEAILEADSTVLLSVFALGTVS